MMSSERKNSIIQNFKIHETDSGSLELQVALLTERINELNKHFESFPKDKASRMGLMKLVGRRRKFLDYLHNSDKNKYEQLIAQLGIRK